jgi:hypothetical protein
MAGNKFQLGLNLAVREGFRQLLPEQVVTRHFSHILHLLNIETDQKAAALISEDSNEYDIIYVSLGNETHNPSSVASSVVPYCLIRSSIFATRNQKRVRHLHIDQQKSIAELRGGGKSVVLFIPLV